MSIVGIPQDAAHARTLLADPMIQGFFEAAARDIYQEWLATPAGATEQRERLWIKSTLVDEMKQYFTNFIIDGQLEDRKHGQTSR